MNAQAKLATIALPALLTATSLFAVPAKPGVFDYQQPDGSTVSITLKGDEDLRWAVTPDGYTLLFNHDGYLEYAEQGANGELQLSGVRTHNAQKRQAEELIFLKNTPQKLQFSPAQISATKEFRLARQAIQEYQRKNKRKDVGILRLPLILVDFPSRSFSKTKTDFELLMNQLDYTSTVDGAITGSTRDYFRASSYGQLDIVIDVFGPFRMEFDAGNYNPHHCRQIGIVGIKCGDPDGMITSAIQQANAVGCDFSNYDANGDGIVDGVHIIFAGYGSESGAPANASIWSHQGSITPLELDGKFINTYTCSSELRGYDGNLLTHIGVIAHELSHVLGVPDLYDTDYEDGGGQSVDLGDWCLMSGSCWNDGGRTPALHSAHIRHTLGWIHVDTLSEPQAISLPNPANEGIAYRINTKTANEYFLLENRQQQGWDAFIPGSGLLIYHVDENYSGWTNNCINCDPAHRGLYIKQAGGGINSDNPDSYYADNDGRLQNKRSTDAYPTANNRSFSDLSTPNAQSWAGENTEKPVTGITNDTSEKSVSFTFGGGKNPDMSLTQILLPTSLYLTAGGRKTDSVRVVVENVGLPLSGANATIQWTVNGTAQTPYLLSGNFATGEQKNLTLGTLTYTAGNNTLIQASLQMGNDSNMGNNTQSHFVNVICADVFEDFESDDIWHWTLGDERDSTAWVIGTDITDESNRCAYLPVVAAKTTDLNYLFRYVTIPYNHRKKRYEYMNISMDVKAVGSWAQETYLKVRLAPVDYLTGESVSLTDVIYNEWQTEKIILGNKNFYNEDEENATGDLTARLVFSWENKKGMLIDSLKYPIVAAVDNIIFVRDTVTEYSDYIEITDLSGNLCPNSFTMIVGQSKQLEATVFPENTTDKTVTWTSNNPTVVSVSNTGLLEAKSTGEATLMLKNGHDTYAYLKIKVVSPENAMNVANISALRTALQASPAGLSAKLTGDVVFVWRNGGNIFVQDNSGALFIQENAPITHTYKSGDTIRGGIFLYGTLYSNRSKMEFISTQDWAEGIAGIPVKPMFSSFQQVYEDKINNKGYYYADRLIKTNNVYLHKIYQSSVTFTDYAGNEAGIALVDNDFFSFICENLFNTLTGYTFENGKVYDITGFYMSEWSNDYIVPRSVEDIYTESNDLPKYTVNITTSKNGTITVGDMSTGEVVYSGDRLDKGTPLLLTAIANLGSTFEQWWDGNTASVRTLTLDSNTTISVTFKHIISAIAEHQTPNTEQLTVSPNPVVDELRITNYELRMGDVVEIFDMNGNRVYMAQPNSTSSIVNSTFSIDVSHLPAGTYIVKIGTSTGSVSGSAKITK